MNSTHHHDEVNPDSFELDNINNDSDSIKLEDLESLPPLSSSRRGLTFLHGLGLVIGLQIGSGIFASPNQVHKHAGSIGASLILWVVGGLLAWTGAESYAELGSAIPQNGGTQAYLNYTFGELPSCIYTWTCILVLKPGSAAIIAIIFGEYIGKAASVTDTIVSRILAIGLIIGITSANCISTNIGAKVGTIFLAIKFTLIGLIILVGIKGLFSKSSPMRETGFWQDTHWSQMSLGLYGALWAYDGWDNLNFVSADMRNAQRDLPRVLNTAMPVVIIMYLLANSAYFAVLSSWEIDASTSVCVTMMQRAFGADTISGKFLEVMVEISVALSCAGALNATTFSSARLVQSAAQEKLIPGQFLGRDSVRFRTPIAALLLQATLTCVYALSGEFLILVEMYGAAGYIFYLAAVIGLLVLRVKEPQLRRPYRAWLVTPLVFSGVATFLIGVTFIKRPMTAIAIGGIILLGIPLYYARKRFAK